MADVSAELNSIRRTLEARDILDAERRKVDDTRDEGAHKERVELIERVNRHGQRMTAIETNWANFFGENGAFTMVRKKLEASDVQNRWIIVFAFSTLVGVIVNLLTKH
jgi:1-aminocyclopropane-1-carboxylate deaminase/D-cysteine desulfhydrase-like pyridoxal-dependent ACC family enzyme